MRSFTVLSGIAAPLPLANVTTDDIYPAMPIVRPTVPASIAEPNETAEYAFANMRYDRNGRLKDDFVLNRPPYTHAKILVARENFGCGSSREHAVWCLNAIGIRCVIACSFGDIFFNNCFKNGMLPIPLGEADVDRLVARISNPVDAQLMVDLREQKITDGSGSSITFTVDSYRRDLLLEGRDEIDLSLASRSDIETFEHAYRERRPWII